MVGRPIASYQLTSVEIGVPRVSTYGAIDSAPTFRLLVFSAWEFLPCLLGRLLGAGHTEGASEDRGSGSPEHVLMALQ